MDEDLVVVDDSEAEEIRVAAAQLPQERSYVDRDVDGDAAVTVDPTRQRPFGKTPYTITMKMRRGRCGYGFSVTWTHPPR